MIASVWIVVWHGMEDWNVAIATETREQAIDYVGLDYVVVADRSDEVTLKHRKAGEIPGCPVRESRQWALVKQISFLGRA